MKKNKVISIIICIAVPFLLQALTFYLPADIGNRRVLNSHNITPAGQFGIYRKPYNNIEGHYHSGIDIKNPGKKPGELNAVYASAQGTVISVLSNGSSSNVIIKHKLEDGRIIYSTYTHISDIVVQPGDSVTHHSVIASFIDSQKLGQWGEYLNHLHFEILRVPPKYVGYRKGNKTYLSYSIDCKDTDMLYEKFYNPILFFIYYDN